MAYTYNESLNIDLLNYSPKYSNRQSLLFKILNKNDDNTYNIIFEDNTIINNVYRLQILNGQIFNPNSKNKIQNRLKIFYHLAYQKAILCKTRIEFSNNYSGLYQNMQRNNWLEDICSHMIKLKNNWTKEECHQKALLCKTRIEFQINYATFYQKAITNNWLDDICLHMISKINPYDYPRIIYVYEFSDKSAYIGLTKNFNIRKASRKYNQRDSVTKYINKTNLVPKIKFLTEFIPAIEAQNKEQEFIDKYRSEGWNILNRKKAGDLG